MRHEARGAAPWARPPAGLTAPERHVGFTTAAIVASLALSAGGTALTMYGQRKAGQSAAQAGIDQKKASDSQADLADYNAKVADLQGKDAVERGALDESKFRAHVRGQIGSQRTGFAAQGVDVGFGSPVDAQADTAYLGELDALTIRNNAAREAWGFQVQATDLRARADIARKTGVYQEKAGQANQSAYQTASWGTLLGGGASLFSQSYGFANAGH